MCQMICRSLGRTGWREKRECGIRLPWATRPPDDSPYFGFRYDMAEGMKEGGGRGEIAREKGGSFTTQRTEGERMSATKK